MDAIRILDRAAESPYPADLCRQQVWLAPKRRRSENPDTTWQRDREKRIEAHTGRVAVEIRQHSESLRRIHARWTTAETRQLRRLLGRGTPLDRIATRLGRSRDSVRLKISHLRSRTPCT